MKSESKLPEHVMFSEETELNRRLGLTEAFSIVVGRIIGSGIFRTPYSIMLKVTAVSMYFGVWIVGGIATFLGAFCYAELAAMMPRSGGPYAYIKAAYGPVWTFLRGWAMFFVSETGAIAVVALVFAESANEFYEIAVGQRFGHGLEVIIALDIIWMLTVANCLGVYLSGILQDIFSFLKLIALGLVIAVCFSKAGNVAHFSTPFWPDEFNWSSILAFGAAMRYGFFAYSGWEGATYVAEEVRQPRRNLPLSIILGISGVLLLYLAANCAYLYQLAPAQIMESKLVAVNAVKTAVGAFGGVLIALAIMMNTFGNVSAQILCKARTWYAMSRDGLFIKSLSKIHPKFKTPNRALIVQAFWASLLLMVAAFAENTYEIIIDFFSFTSSIFNVMTFAAVWILRQKYPDVMRPFKTWGYPVTLIIVLLIQLAFMIITLITALVPSLIGISLTSTGLLYYYRRDIGVWLRKLFSILRM